ncbi:MAG: histidine phosphatase family protein [Elstera sp.]
MIPLLLIRHGPTAWTEAGRLQGRADQPLSELGREMLRRRELPPEFLAWDWISSPLQRAVETGLILRGMLARLEHVLIERDAGAFEGLTRAELEAQSAALRLRDGLDWCPPGGESPRQVMARLSPWLLRLARPTVAITHRGVIEAALALATGWDYTGPPPAKIKPGVALRFAVTAGKLRFEGPLE